MWVGGGEDLWAASPTTNRNSQAQHCPQAEERKRKESQVCAGLSCSADWCPGRGSGRVQGQPRLLAVSFPLFPLSPWGLHLPWLLPSELRFRRTWVRKAETGEVVRAIPLGLRAHTQDTRLGLGVYCWASGYTAGASGYTAGPSGILLGLKVHCWAFGYTSGPRGTLLGLWMHCWALGYTAGPRGILLVLWVHCWASGYTVGPQASVACRHAVLGWQGL